jgi:hypothetical protein
VEYGTKVFVLNSSPELQSPSSRYNQLYNQLYRYALPSSWSVLAFSEGHGLCCGTSIRNVYKQLNFGGAAPRCFFKQNNNDT